MHIDYYWSEDFFRDFQKKILSMWEELNSQTMQLAYSCNRDIICKIKMQKCFDEVTFRINKLNEKICNILNILLEYFDVYIEICNFDRLTDDKTADDNTISLSVEEFAIDVTTCEEHITTCFDNMVYALKSYLAFIKVLKEFEKTFESGFNANQDEYELINGIIDSIKEIDETIWIIEDILRGLEDKRWEVIPLAPSSRFN